MFGNIGTTELLVIALIILLLFGAKRIPEIAGSMGKGIREFKRNLNEAKREITDGTSSTDQRIGSGDLEARPPGEAERSEPKRLIQ